jgi:hypothetical protein
MEEDKGGENLPSEEPSSIFIGGPAKAENILSGSINKNKENKNIKFWGNNNIEETYQTPSWAWFLIGLILIPIVLSIISTLILTIADSGLLREINSSNITNGDNVTINDQTFEVYIFTMSSNFDNNYGTTFFWDLNIESSNPGSLDWMTYISGYYDIIDQRETQDDSSIIWYESDSHSDMQDVYDDPSVYMRVIENKVLVAVGDNLPPPTFCVYYWENNDPEMNSIIFSACLIWPVTIMGGTIWSFRTDRKPLAYGLLSSGIVAIIALLLFSFLWFIGF